MQPTVSFCVSGSRMDEEIIRVIHNASPKYNVCSMARGRYGLKEYARLRRLLAAVDTAHLDRYLDAIDAVRATHRCALCGIKLVAFCRVYCSGRLAERLRAYTEEYHRLAENIGSATRNFQNEVADSIRDVEQCNASSLRERVFVTDIRLFREDLDDVAERTFRLDRSFYPAHWSFDPQGVVFVPPDS